jgi:hypothetical protein
LPKDIVIENTNIENKIKEKATDVEKSNKELYSSEQKTFNLTSNIIEEHYFEIIEKIQTKIPSYVKFYSNLYKKYLHMMSNFYDTYYLTQKEVFGKTEINDIMLTLFDIYLRNIKQLNLLQINISENMVKNYVEYRITVLDFYDQMINNNMRNFVKKFLDFNLNK